MHRTSRGYDSAMAIYTVHIPPVDNPEGARFVREGVNVFALIVPLLWLLWHRLWLSLAVYLLAILLVSIFARFAGPVPGLFMSILPGFYLFVEGNELIRNRLSRAGWVFAGVVSAENPTEAEIRFFSQTPAGEPTPFTTPKAEPKTEPKPFGRQYAPQSFGMFPE